MSGLTEVGGEQLLYLEVNKEVTFTVNGTDDGTFTYKVSSTVADITTVETDDKVDVTAKVLSTDPQSLR